MKKIIMLLMLVTAMLTMQLNSFACGTVTTNGKTLFSNLGNGIITIDGEKQTLPNSFTANAYTEFQKRTYIEEEYDAVSFYLQMSPGTDESNGEDSVRVILNQLSGPGANPDSATDRLYQTQHAYTLKNGEDAIHVTIPFKYTNKEGEVNYFNNFYVIFAAGGNNDGKINTVMADIQFIKYEPLPPTAKVTDTEVATVDGETRSIVNIEFSQRMNPDTAGPEDFMIDGEAVQSVEFDETGKIATLTCSKLMGFDTDFELTISENLKNLCEFDREDCLFSVDEESRILTVMFPTPVPVMIGNGHFTDAYDNELDSMTSGKITYSIPVENVYDLTEGGRHFTLVTVMYIKGELKRIYFDDCTLLPGDSAELSRTISVSESNAPNTEIQAFLWDNAYDMNAFADMSELKPQSSSSEGV